MADCHKLFTAFNNTIWFNEDDLEPLRASRDSLRKKIKDAFSGKDGYSPEFVGQGSFRMKTIIHRIDGNHDVDDGIYFSVPGEPDRSVSTIQKWVHDAVDDHTTMDTQERKNCVRVQFKDSHHVDFPIYFEIPGQSPQLGYRSGEWKKSDPVAFVDWFEGKTTDTNGQLRRLVRYAKAWLDYQISRSFLSRGDNLKGITLTILIAEHYVKDDRDDIAFLNTIKKIHSKLSLRYECFRPTEPTDEDLLSGYSEDNKERVLAAFNKLIESGDAANESPVEKDACKKWKSHFGARFSCDSASDSHPEAKMLGERAVIVSTGRSALEVQQC